MNVEMTEQEWTAVLEILATASVPWKATNPLINKIATQIKTKIDSTDGTNNV